MSEEVVSKQMKRYLDNKEKDNARAKRYFRSVYYVNNRDAILERVKQYRDSHRTKTIHPSRVKEFDNNLTVCFD